MMRPARRPAFWVGLLAAVFLLTSVAEARSRRRKRPSPAREAARYFKKGKRLYKKERFDKAIVMFRKAFATLPHKNILLNIAICHAEMGEPVKAMVQLRLALKMAGKTAEQLLDPKEYRKLLDMQKRVAILKITAPDLRAIIFLNGESLGSSKMDRVLYPGSYLVEVKLDDKVMVRRIFKLEGGARDHWNMESWATAATTPAETTKKPRRKRRRLHIAYVAAAAGLTLVATGAVIGTGVRTEQLKDKFETSGGEPRYEDEGKKYRTATNVLIGVTVAAAAATVVLAIFTDWSIFKKSKEAPKATVLPYAGPGAGGLVVMGRF
jgi:tetratricopeptide (TPR) repeat protein